MQPTFQQGDKITADMRAYAFSSPKRWDVVVVRPKMEEFKDIVWVMRVVALPGEKISFSEGHILIDGTPVEQPPPINSVRFHDIVPHPSTGLAPTAYPYAVPKESYYLLGDNALAAYDSRSWGVLPRGNILGRVFAK